MNAAAQLEASPEWEQARNDWRRQTEGELARVLRAIHETPSGELAKDVVYAPVHDVAGLAGVFGYDLLTKVARALMEHLRRGADPLDAGQVQVSKAYLSTLVALHAKDIRGDGGPAGEAILVKLASVRP